MHDRGKERRPYVSAGLHVKKIITININDLIRHVEKEIGKIARPEEIHFVPDLPKTRSGKIRRRVVRRIAMGEEPGDITTLANPEAVEKIKETLEKEKFKKE